MKYAISNGGVYFLFLKYKDKNFTFFFPYGDSRI